MTAAAEETPDVLTPGTKLGSFEIVRLLGMGGMGSVYEARHVALAKRVAIKTLHRRFALEAPIRGRFLNEGRAAAAIEHPHVVDVHDVGVQDDVPFLVMDFLEGEDLAALVAREGPLPPQTIADILIPVCSALGAAHDAGVVHRDLKPENIFLQQTATGLVPKVLDFGVSKLGGDDSLVKTGTSQLLGTPYYMSPEQARSSKAVDPRTDVWAIGVILYELTTGVRPFESDVLYELLTLIVAAHPTAVDEHRPDAPPELVALTHRALALEPESRPASIRALGARLLPFASDSVQQRFESELTRDSIAFASTAAGTSTGDETPPPQQAAPAVSGVRAAPGAPSAKRMRWVALALVAAALGVGGWLLARSEPETVVEPRLNPAPEAPSTFRVRVRATPSSAELRLDDEDAFATGLIERTLPRDGRVHRLRVSADGFESETVTFTEAAPPSTIVLRPSPELPAADVPEVERPRSMRATMRASRMHAERATQGEETEGEVSEVEPEVPDMATTPRQRVLSDGTSTL